jgi:alpha-beta hydrolase superfamily lysophospholipase
LTKREFFFGSADRKTQIHCIEWRPEETPRAILQIAHGIASHVSRFEPLAEYMCARGVAVVGNDHLGHGESVAGEDDRMIFAETGGWEMALSDLRTLTGLTRETFPGVPLFLLGHSMGSFLARCYAIKWQDGIDGLILSGTGQQSAALVKAGRTMAEGEVKRHGARYKSDRLEKLMFGSYTRQIKPCRTPLDWLSRDPETVDRYMADPQCGGVPAAALVCDMLGGIAYMSRAENQKRMNKTLPVFFFSGDADPVGDYGKGVIRSYLGFLDAGMQDVTLKLYPGGRHEMLNEINKDKVYQDILNWLNSKLEKL